MKLHQANKPTTEKKDFAKLIEAGDYYVTLDNLINESPTASMLVLKFKEFCILDGIFEERKKLWDNVVDEYIKYGHFTLYAQYNPATVEIRDVHFRKSKFYRSKEQDDTGYISEFYNVKTKVEIPSFNKSKEAVLSQVKSVDGWDNFIGQIYQYNTTTNQYQYSVFCSVLPWLEVENDTPTFITKASDNALFGNNIYIIKKGAETTKDDNGNVIVTRTDMILDALKQGKGVKGATQNYVLEVTGDEDVKEIFTKIQIGNDVEIDKYNSVDDKAGKKICTAGYCFPQILCNPSEGLFGNSGEAYKVALESWKQTCLYHSKKIEEAFTEIGIKLRDKTDDTNTINGIDEVLSTEPIDDSGSNKQPNE